MVNIPRFTEAWRTSRISTAWLSICLGLLFASTFIRTVAAADKTAADYYLTSLPGQPEGPLLKMHAGHVEITPEHNGHLFFWHFANRHIANRQRTVIWLNGGPGCSSMDGALMEIGPYRIQEGGKLEYNEGSWDEFANLLFVDNPVGTGFSYVNGDSYLHELQEMADQMVVFLEKWFKIFPEYAEDDIYFAGESYAGQHIPYIARTIMDRNKDKQEAERWNVKGLLIGNGWIAPSEQYMAYLPFAYQEGLLVGGSEGANRVERQNDMCRSLLSKPENADKVDLLQCESILSMILEVSRTDDNKMCYNMYDIRLKDTWSSCGMNWPPDLDQVTPYLRRADVVKALHINPDMRTGWKECTGAVSANFKASNSKPAVDFLPSILEEGVPILLFSGASDMICNHLGTEDFVSTMKWSGGTGMELSTGVLAPRRDWTFEDQPAGIYQEARNLTYVLFYNASHMVPFDWPRRSRDMLDRFMGVDIASIGGKPVNSIIDGEKAGTETSVGGHPNSTVALEEEKEKLRQAELKAYYRSGEVVLVLVIIGAVALGWWWWRGQRLARQQGYASVPMMGNGMLHKGADVEAGDFDENELHDLRAPKRGTRVPGSGRDMDTDPYDLASDSEEEDEQHNRGAEKVPSTDIGR